MQRWDKLNERQLAVLRRIAAGEDLSGDENIPARTSANALRNRGLVTIQRRGGSWDAEITDAGRFYLANGHHPDDPRRKESSPATRDAGPRQLRVKRSVENIQPSTPTPTITDQRRAAAEVLVGRLVADRKVAFPLETDADLAHWRRVIDFAKRHGMAPAGTRIEKSQPYPGGKLVVELLDGSHPNTSPSEPVRPAVPVPDQLRSLHPVVAALKADTNHLKMPAGLRLRSLRIMQALAAELTRRSHVIRQCREQHYARRQGQFDVGIGENSYTVEIRQESPNSADEEKALRLLLALPAYRSTRRHEWADRKRTRLEDWLADICDELETRAEEDDQRRIDEARKEAERRRDWESAMAKARVQAIETHRTDALTAQVDRWNLASAIRTYCDALEQRLAQAVDPAASGIDWLTWARARAESLDPLTSVPTMPADPELTADDLKPFLGQWSPYGPDQDRRGFTWR